MSKIELNKTKKIDSKEITNIIDNIIKQANCPPKVEMEKALKKASIN